MQRNGENAFSRLTTPFLVDFIRTVGAGGEGCVGCWLLGLAGWPAWLMWSGAVPGMCVWWTHGHFAAWILRPFAIWPPPQIAVDLTTWRSSSARRLHVLSSSAGNALSLLRRWSPPRCRLSFWRRWWWRRSEVIEEVIPYSSRAFICRHLLFHDTNEHYQFLFRWRAARRYGRCGVGRVNIRCAFSVCNDPFCT